MTECQRCYTYVSCGFTPQLHTCEDCGIIFIFPVSGWCVFDPTPRMLCLDCYEKWKKGK
jgi:hypothetical protein